MRYAWCRALIADSEWRMVATTFHEKRQAPLFAYARKGMRRVHSVAKAHTDQYNGYRYISLGGRPLCLPGLSVSDSFLTTGQIIAPPVTQRPLERSSADYQVETLISGLCPLCRYQPD
ncbi:MAG: hypothetical protein R6V33_00265 [Pelovirga sp.]